MSLGSGCGKKQKNIFLFEEEHKKHHHPFIGLPVVKKIITTSCPQEVVVSWQPIDITTLPGPSIHFVGYDVYRLTQAGIIPKKPINKQPITDISFIDKAKNVYRMKTAGYLIRAVFSQEKIIFSGPSSRVAAIKK